MIGVLLPSQSLIPAHTALSMELWAVLRLFPYTTRFRFYHSVQVSNPLDFTSPAPQLLISWRSPSCRIRSLVDLDHFCCILWLRGGVITLQHYVAFLRVCIQCFTPPHSPTHSTQSALDIPHPRIPLVVSARMFESIPSTAMRLPESPTGVDSILNPIDIAATQEKIDAEPLLAAAAATAATELKKVLRRVHQPKDKRDRKEGLKLYGRMTGKISHSNPLAVASQMLQLVRGSGVLRCVLPPATRACRPVMQCRRDPA